MTKSPVSIARSASKADQIRINASSTRKSAMATYAPLLPEVWKTLSEIHPIRIICIIGDEFGLEVKFNRNEAVTKEYIDAQIQDSLNPCGEIPLIPQTINGVFIHRMPDEEDEFRSYHFFFTLTGTRISMNSQANFCCYNGDLADPNSIERMREFFQGHQKLFASKGLPLLSLASDDQDPQTPG